MPMFPRRRDPWVGDGGAAPPTWSLSSANIVYTGDGGMIYDPKGGNIAGGFGTNVIPYLSYGGKTYYRGEAGTTNLHMYSQALGSWTANDVDISADATTDPLGGSTADSMLAKNGSAAHNATRTPSYTNTNWYTQSVFAKVLDYNYCGQTWSATRFPGTPAVVYKISDGTIYSEAGGTGIIQPCGSYYRCHLVAQCDSTGTNDTYVGLRDNTPTSPFSGDGKGTYFWQKDVVAKRYPVSPIATTNVTVTRASDVSNIASANVPANFLTLAGKIKLIIHWAYNLDTTDRVVMAVGADDYIIWDGTNKKFAVYAGGVKKVESGALTFSYGANITLTWTPASGKLKVEGAATGDSEETGTAWTWASGQNLYLGNDSAGASQIGALWSLPEMP